MRLPNYHERFVETLRLAGAVGLGGPFTAYVAAGRFVVAGLPVLSLTGGRAGWGLGYARLGFASAAAPAAGE